MAAFDEMGEVFSRLRELVNGAESYRRQAFYESASDLYLELVESMERTWEGCEKILEELDE